MPSTAPAVIAPELLDPARAMHTVTIPGIEPWRHGKVRSIYEAGPDTLVDCHRQPASGPERSGQRGNGRRDAIFPHSPQ